MQTEPDNVIITEDHEEKHVKDHVEELETKLKTKLPDEITENEKLQISPTTYSPDEITENEKLQISPATYSLIKFLSVLFWLVSFLLFGTLVFAGIEGSNENLQNYILLLKQSEFNRTHRQNRTDLEFEKFYNHSLQVADTRCSLAKLDLYAWNSMNYADSLTFCFSILTTVGWGVHCPVSVSGKVLTLIYALFGIPVVAALIGIFISFLDALKKRKVKMFKLTRKYFGNFDIVSIVVAYFCVAFGILDGYLMTLAAKWFSSGLEDKLEKVGLSSDLSLTEGIYFVFINVLTVVGFGDQYFFSKGSRADLIILQLVNFLPILVYFAAMKRFFSLIMRYIDYSVDKKLNIVYQAVEGVSDEQESVEKSTDSVNI